MSNWPPEQWADLHSIKPPRRRVRLEGGMRQHSTTSSATTVSTQTGFLDFSAPVARPPTGLRLLAPKQLSVCWQWQSWLVGLWAGPNREWSLRPRGSITGWTVVLHLLCLTVYVTTGTPLPDADPRER